MGVAQCLHLVPDDAEGQVRQGGDGMDVHTRSWWEKSRPWSTGPC